MASTDALSLSTPCVIKEEAAAENWEEMEKKGMWGGTHLRQFNQGRRLFGSNHQQLRPPHHVEFEAAEV